MRNELQGKIPGVEDRIRSLRAELLAVPDADADPVCTDCGDTVCTHAGTLFSGGTDIPQVRDS
jgi:hypothetical protein